MDEYITRAEHTEFCARLDAENNRQNRRIEILEGRNILLAEDNDLNADKHSPASSARSTKRRVRGMLMSVGVESSH